MKIEQASRQQVKIKMALQGPSGSGKTMGALLIAFGLCSDWKKIALIDTEARSASLYADLGNFNVVNLNAPFTPERYMEAIKLCEREGMEAIIIDSLSHEWEGEGGILDCHSKLPGNSFINWSKLTPRHTAFLQVILQSSAHIISTIRSKQDYILNEKNGKQIPEKVGLKGVMRDNTDYEMTIVLNIDIQHKAKATKDRTGLFMDKPEFVISKHTGQLINDWCNLGTNDNLTFETQIESCQTLPELNKLYKDHPDLQHAYTPKFTQKKIQLSNRTI